MSTYGEKITKLRKANNLTQAELGEKLNVSAQAVSKWENDLSEPDIGALKKLSSLFNVSLDELLDNNDNVKTTGVTEVGKYVVKLLVQNKNYIDYNTTCNFKIRIDPVKYAKKNN